MYGVAAIGKFQHDRFLVSTEKGARSWPRIEGPWPRSPQRGRGMAHRFLQYAYRAFISDEVAYDSWIVGVACHAQRGYLRLAFYEIYLGHDYRSSYMPI
jgi:hypothetical protein